MRRPERFADSLRDEIAEIVGYELDDPRLGGVVVTDVVVASDLRDAKVFVLITGSEEQINDALRALRHASTFVRQQVAMALDLRHAPHLHFVRDTAEENAARVGEILDRLEVPPEDEPEPE